VIAAMLISTFMAAAEVTVISTAMPTIVARLRGFDLFTWAFGVYLLGQAVTTPIYGRLADLDGHRAVYLGSMVLFLVGSLLCGLAWSMPALIVFRAIQGLGGGGLMPLATMVISDVTAPADRPRLLSYVTGVWGIAAIIGPLIGSLCISTVGWPFVFWTNLPIGAITITFVMCNLVCRTGDGLWCWWPACRSVPVSGPPAWSSPSRCRRPRPGRIAAGPRRSIISPGSSARRWGRRHSAA